MRTPKELFEILRDNKLLFTHGLCIYVCTLAKHYLITYEELKYLDEYIEQHPSLLYKFGLTSGAYYWKKHKWKPRLRWINRQIKEFS